MTTSSPSFVILNIALGQLAPFGLIELGLAKANARKIQMDFGKQLTNLQHIHHQKADSVNQTPGFAQQDPAVTLQAKLHQLMRETVYYQYDSAILQRCHQLLCAESAPLHTQLSSAQKISITPQIILLGFAYDLLEYQQPAKVITLLAQDELNSARALQQALIDELTELSADINTLPMEHDHPPLSHAMKKAKINAFQTCEKLISVELDKLHHALNHSEEQRNAFFNLDITAFPAYRQAVLDFLMITDEDIEQFHAQAD